VHPECVDAAEAASFVPLPGEVMSQDLTSASLPWVRLLGDADPDTGELDELVRNGGWVLVEGGCCFVSYSCTDLCCTQYMLV
jgi:hypothetical protein